jgi:excinuclease ABC subunit A
MAARRTMELSGGEAQRIRLASQLGSNLRGVCYILDEPTIGLHARDTRMLLATLNQLKERGNTVVVVEHDEETIRRADHVIDLGPGGGSNGGRLVAAGTVAELINNPESVTGQYLQLRPSHRRRPRPAPQADLPEGASRYLSISGARLYNLKGLDLAIPLGLLVATGVSVGQIHPGAGGRLKTCISCWRPGASRAGGLPASLPVPRGCAAISGWQQLARPEVTSGRSATRCPATYVGL